MAELNDYCQCCYVRLPDDWLGWRCKNCNPEFNGCDKCTKCSFHCPHVEPLIEEGE